MLNLVSLQDVEMTVRTEESDVSSRHDDWRLPEF
jgi:hypothetical protein